MDDINEEDRVPFNVHTAHHRWIEEKKKEEKASKERIEKVKTSVFSSLFIAIILGISSIVIEYFKGDK